MNKEEQRYVIHFFWLQKKRPKEIFEKMKVVYGEKTLNLMTIRRWMKKFDDGQDNINDSTRSGRPKKNHLILPIKKLLEENPYLSTKKMGEKLGVSKETINRILKEDLDMKKINFKWIPYVLDSGLRKKRVETSKILLSKLVNLSLRERSLIMTGDETWLYLDNPRTFMWNREKIKLTKPKITISSKKIMISVIWSPSGFHSIVKLNEGKKFNKEFFIKEVLDELSNNIEKRRPKKKFNGLKIHLDNARPHLVDEEFTRMKLERIPHPPYSPDLAPSDFFLFGYLKKMLEGQSFIDGESLFVEATKILKSINREILEKVYDEWIKRLEKCIENEGEYIF